VGGAIEGAAVKIREVSTGRVRTVMSRRRKIPLGIVAAGESTKLRFPMELIRSRKTSSLTCVIPRYFPFFSGRTMLESKYRSMREWA